MDMITIFQSLMRWGIPALAGGIALLLIIAIAFFTYKKAFHGKKTITKLQLASAILLCCWLILVLGLTSLSRGANYTGEFNVDFFSSYINAWNNWSISELQLIIFNMLMFIPLGFLLPLLWKKAERIHITLVVSLGATALIELIQFFTGTGIFELDDLFHNLVGSLFGYFCIMAITTSIQKKRLQFAPFARVLIIPCLISLIIGAVFWVYDHQPYGNMDILPAVKQNMSAVHVTTALKLSDDDAAASIYKNIHAGDKTYVQNIQSKLCELEGLVFFKTTRRENENYIYTGRDARNNAFQMDFFFRRGHWSYTTFQENAAQLTAEMAQQYKNRYESWLKENELLPENAVFSVQNANTLRWDVTPSSNLQAENEEFQSGSIMIQFDEGGSVIDIFYQIDWNVYVATEDIISPSEAYDQVLNGNFEQYVPFQQGDMLYVEKCTLTYAYDTKGFYQPVYRFDGYINGTANAWNCQIPALKK